ncbi:MAG TPA: DMT family transporter [Candidatus Saccharimonadales bacterium]|nr:DMT family transporter [Candidatus Saccharimonadales bacterium]
MDKTPRPAKAAAMLFAATTAWGASFLVMKALGQEQEKLVPGAGSWFISSYSLLIRFGVSALVVSFLTRSRNRKITPLEWRQGVGLGLFCGTGILFQMDGVMHTAASTSAFLTQCYCIFIPFVLAFHRRKMPAAMIVLSCLMVMGGVAVLSNIDWQRLRVGRGEAESILGSILFTGQILWLERPIFHANRTPVITLLMFTFVALVVLPVFLWSGTGPQQWIAAYHSWPAVLLVGFLTLACTFGSYSIMNYWQPHLPATQAGLIYCCEPMFTAIFALFLPACLSRAMQINYPNEILTSHLLLGGGLITAANLLAMWEGARHAKSDSLDFPPKPNSNP